MKKKFLTSNMLFKLIKVMLIIVLIEPNIIGLVSAAANDNQNVNISITPDPLIDIVLAKPNDGVDMSSFNVDIINALGNKGIDTEKIKISALETSVNEVSSEDIDVDQIINNWQIVGADTWRATNGEIFSSTGGGQTKPAWWGTGLINPNGFGSTTYSCDFTMVTGGKLNEGVCFNVTINDDGSLNGYFIAICNHTSTTCALFKFNHYTLDQAFDTGINKIMWCGPHYNGWNLGQTYTYESDSYEVLKTWNIGVSENVKYNIDYKDEHIKVIANNQVVAELDDDTYKMGSYGFWGNNCEMSTYMYLKDIKITNTTVKAKKLSEVLREPEWRTNANKFLINLDSGVNEDLKEESSLNEILVRIMNEEINFVQWGNANNKEIYENMIRTNNENGKFIEDLDYNNSIEETAQYIKEIIDKIQEQEKQYVIVDEPIKVSISPDEIKANTIDAYWPYGKWKVSHDYTFFENNLGQSAESGKYTSDFITAFDKTGKYEIYYQDQQVYPGLVYVHRKPVAQINLSRNGNNITLSSDSYDVDEISKENKGISEEEWKWKALGDATWTTGKLTTIDSNKEYIITLRVKDNQETWSDITAKNISSNINTLPVAIFNITNEKITKYEELEVNDSSYDPAGGNITSREWEIYKGDNLIYTGDTPKTSYLTEENGEYTIYLTVTNDKNKVSERFGRKFIVIDDIVAPEVVVTPTSCDWIQSQVVHLEFMDQGGSGVKNYKYAITDNQSIPDSWSLPIEKSLDDIIINQNGTKYLHIIAEDNAGNISNDRITGLYKIDNLAPEINITGDLTNEKLNNLQLNIEAIDELSGVKLIRINNQEINDTQCNFFKNGTYTIEAEDNVGNKKTETLEINNIYYECPNNLGHPHYSSSYDKCPICATIEGEGGTRTLQVTNSRKVYNGELQGVSYDNPNNVTIVEYYNGSKQKVKDVGTYQYSLKAIYNGNEYDTGVSGIFEIAKKDIMITGLQAQNRTYDTTDSVRITGGTLQGVVSGDDVRAVIPETGKTESSSPGSWKVRSDNIQLAGADAENYNLIQPQYGSITVTIEKAVPQLVIECSDKTYDGNSIEPRKVSGSNSSEVIYTFYKHGENIPLGSITKQGRALNAILMATNNSNVDAPLKVGTYDVVGHQESDGNYEAVTSEIVTFTISKKEITIKGIEAKNKTYDGTNIAQITGGTIEGVVEGDIVSAVIPETGKFESNNLGTWKVELGDIQLTGADAENYTLQQPEYGTITATIEQAEPGLVIECPDKIYDGKPVEAKKISGNNNSNIVYRYFIKGEDKEIEAPKDAGEYEVIGYQENEGNYGAVTSEKVTFKIMPKELIIEGITAEDREEDSTDIVKLSGGTLKGIIDGEVVTAIIPKTGTAESKEVGTWKVTIDEIKLSGADASNYTLKQPNNITVKISKKVVIDTTVATIAIPYTGEVKIVVLLGIVLSIVTGIISYSKIRKINKKRLIK